MTGKCQGWLLCELRDRGPDLPIAWLAEAAAIGSCWCCMRARGMRASHLPQLPGPACWPLASPPSSFGREMQGCPPPSSTHLPGLVEPEVAQERRVRWSGRQVASSAPFGFSPAESGHLLGKLVALSSSSKLPHLLCGSSQCHCLWAANAVHLADVKIRQEPGYAPLSSPLLQHPGALAPGSTITKAGPAFPSQTMLKAACSKTYKIQFTIKIPNKLLKH